MSVFRDIFVLILLGFYLLMAWTSQATTLPIKTSEEIALSMGHQTRETMLVAKGRLNKKDLWFIEYRVGQKIVGRKILLPDYYNQFKKELDNHLKYRRTKSLAGSMNCPSPVLVHHRNNRGKIDRNEICPPLLSQENRIKFGQWYSRWRNLVNRSQVF
ncbi:MAG: hypothetical protein H6624_19205 [Bdellovibrionaceae bacterium]|nr:hypothetical protein [Bdellovibrionales bacterium]MCB9086477.1 hypothetical protein [Pseudobdellovibrionaceae bacterium]